MIRCEDCGRFTKDDDITALPTAIWHSDAASWEPAQELICKRHIFTADEISQRLGVTEDE